MVKCPYPLYEIDLFDKKECLCIDYTDLHDYVKAFICSTDIISWNATSDH